MDLVNLVFPKGNGVFYCSECPETKGFRERHRKTPISHPPAGKPPIPAALEPKTQTMPGQSQPGKPRTKNSRHRRKKGPPSAATDSGPSNIQRGKITLD